MQANPVLDALLGLAVGDALGVPYEFSPRDKMQTNPAKGLIGYGTHNQPPATWSDDSSLSFCLAESLLDGYNLAHMARKFIDWKEKAYWTARGEVFDIGRTTSQAISRCKAILDSGELAELKMLKKSAEDSDNGNGSLMRILPLLFYLKGKPIQEQFDLVWEVSALTHRHIRAAMSCLIYLKMGEKLLMGIEKRLAYSQTRKEIWDFWRASEFPQEESLHFQKIIQQDIRDTSWEELKSGGYVIEVLESAFWFLLDKENYEDTVLGIINLGHDTDTSAAIVGGLAGVYYGQKNIPDYWVLSLARMEDIIELGEKLNQKYPKR